MVPRQARCPANDHRWLAFFFESGRLAYWRCTECGLADRPTDGLPERLEPSPSWPPDAPEVVARGPRPPVPDRRWTTPDGLVLIEGEPSCTGFRGAAIPDLAESYSYVLVDGEGSVREEFAPACVRHRPFYDHYTLTRYLVVEGELVRFSVYCFEESTFDIPNAHRPNRKSILTGLRPLPKPR